MPFIYCLLFGALISPADPIAVLAIINQLKASQGISIQVEGKSLFNDGVSLVILTIVYAVAFSGVEPTLVEISKLFAVDAVGGTLFGLGLGLALAVIGHVLLLRSPDANIRLMLTLMFPTAGFALAKYATYFRRAGDDGQRDFLGNITRPKSSAMAGRISAVDIVRNFWHAVDSMLNTLLFLLIGLTQIGIGLLMVPLVLLARFVSVGTPLLVFRCFRRYELNPVRILTWGGLRGGLALAMAASIHDKQMSNNGVDLYSLILIFTDITVQELTISPQIHKSIEYARPLQERDIT